MFSFLDKNMEQKELFFQIDSEFKKVNSSKLSGIYAIYKDDLCLYVGQSKNIASRIATHLSGKYKKCSKVLIFSTVDSDDNLIPLEKFVIQQLKPIENVLADYTEKINFIDFAEGSIVYSLDMADCFNEEFILTNANDFIIINNKYSLFISNE